MDGCQGSNEFKEAMDLRKQRIKRNNGSKEAMEAKEAMDPRKHKEAIEAKEAQRRHFVDRWVH